MPSSTPPSVSPAWLRGYWTFIGPLLLLVVAAIVIKTGSGWFTAADLAFFVVALSIVLARVKDFRGGDRRTSTNQPATPGDVRRYCLMSIGYALGGWVVANILGNYVMSR
jgi:hypothetical protein